MLAQQVGTALTRYFTHDAQGGIRAILNNGGTTFTDTYDYNAFGDIYNLTGTTPNRFRYTGQQYDAATGLYFLRARYYDPAIGRFLSQDPYPVNTDYPVELNRYVYTANNPVNFADPSGLAGTATLEYAELLTIGIGLTAIVWAASIPFVNNDAIVEAIDDIEWPSPDDVEEWLRNRPGGGSGSDPDDDGGGKGPRFDPIGAFGRIVKVIAKFATGIALVLSAAVWIAGQVIKHVVPYVVPRVMPGEKIEPQPERPKECDPRQNPECEESEKTVLGYRAEPRERMLVDVNGNVSIPYVKGRQRLGVKLHIGFDKARAIWWLNKPQKGWIVEFKVPESYLEWLRAVALPETPAQRFLPARVDLEWRDQYSIPPLLIPALEGAIIPGSGRKVYDASNLR